jgi:hypothetical protein
VRSIPLRFTSEAQALRDDQGNVVVLLVGTVPADFVHDGGKKLPGRKGAVAAQGFNQALFAKLFAVRAKSFRDAVGVQGEGVSGKKLTLFDVTFPILESAENRRGGREALEGIIRAQEQS